MAKKKLNEYEISVRYTIVIEATIIVKAKTENEAVEKAKEDFETAYDGLADSNIPGIKLDASSLDFSYYDVQYDSSKDSE
jgi:tyrosyl-tRNA synthetase